MDRRGLGGRRRGNCGLGGGDERFAVGAAKQLAGPALHHGRSARNRFVTIGAAAEACEIQAGACENACRRKEPRSRRRRRACTVADFAADAGASRDANPHAHDRPDSATGSGRATSSGGGKPPRANPHLVVTCSGAFAKDSSHLKLAMAYDLKNVDFSEVDAGAGKTMASIIYPKDPKRRLEVWWQEPERRKDTYLIAINGQSTWAGPDGLRLGLNLADLEKLNRKPFKLKGFDKDSIASVTDWDGGTLSALPGGCKAGVMLRADVKVPPTTLSALPADREFFSIDPAMRAANPAVSEILIGY